MFCSWTSCCDQWSHSCAASLLNRLKSELRLMSHWQPHSFVRWWVHGSIHEHLMQLRAAYSQDRISSLLSDKLTHASVLQELINILQAIGEDAKSSYSFTSLLVCRTRASRNWVSLETVASWMVYLYNFFLEGAWVTQQLQCHLCLQKHHKEQMR